MTKHGISVALAAAREAAQPSFYPGKEPTGSSGSDDRRHAVSRDRLHAELMENVTSPGLQARGTDIHAIWSSLAAPGKFLGLDSVAFMRALVAHAPDPDWAHWMSVRYLPMK